MGIVLLLALLLQKELASVAGDRFQKLVKTLNVGLVPLLLAFVMILVSKVVEVVR
jgi:hypothetical protein